MPIRSVHVLNVDQELSEMSENRSERPMSSLAEAQGLLHGLALPARPGEGVGAAMLRAARRLPRWSANRVKDVWYADPRISVSGDEVRDLRAAARADAAILEIARDEYALLLSRLAACEAALGLRATDTARNAGNGERQAVR